MRARLDKAVRMPVMKVLIDFENTGFGSMDSWTDISDYVHEISASKQKEGEVLGGVSSDIVTLTVDNSTNAFSIDNPNSFFYKKQRSNLRFVIMAGFNCEKLIPYMIGYVNSLKPTWKGKTYTLNCTCPIEKLKKAKVPKMSYKNVKWDFLVHELLDKAGIEEYFIREIPTTELNYSYFKFEEEKCFDSLKKLMEAVCGVAYFDGNTFRVETQLAINYSKDKDVKHDLIADDFFEFEESIDDNSVLNTVTITSEPKEVCPLETVAKTPENITRVDNETTVYDGSGLVYIDRANLPLYISNEHSEHGVTVENLTRGGTLEWSNYNVEEGYVRLKESALSNVVKGDTLSLTYDYQLLTLLPNQEREYSLTCEDEVDAFLEPDVVAWNPSVTANIPYSSIPNTAGSISKQYAKLSEDKKTITIALKNNTNDKLSISTLQFRGYPIRVNNPIEVHAEDAESIKVYDERETSIGNNYINNIRLAEKLAQFIIDNKSDIPKTLSVQVSGYAELMLGDICLVTEKDSYTNHLMEIQQVDFTFNPNSGWLTTLSLLEVPDNDWVYGGFDGDSIISKPPTVDVDPYVKSEEPPLDTSKIWIDSTTNKMYVYDSSTNSWIPMVGELPEDGVSKDELNQTLQEESTKWKQEVNVYAEQLAQGRELAILKGNSFPASAIEGQLFINISDNNSMYRWNGTEWVKVGLSEDELQAIRNEIKGVADDLDDTLESLNQTKQDLIDTEKELQQTDAELREQAANLLAQTNGLQGSVSTINQTIDEINGQLDVTATKTEVENLVNGIKVGTRNLIRYTDFSNTLHQSKWATYTHSHTELTYVDGWMKIGAKTAGTLISVVNNDFHNEHKLKSETEYTLSFEAYASTPTEMNYFYTLAPSGDGTNQSLTDSYNVKAQLTTTSQKYVFAFKTNQNFNTGNKFKLVLGARSMNAVGDAIYIKNIQLEEGNKASTWMIAPEDIQGDIKTIENTVTQNTLDIALNATEISKRMTQTQVQNIVSNTVNEIEVGGTNILASTYPAFVHFLEGSPNNTKDGYLHNLWGSVFINHANTILMLEPNTEYTVSYKVKLMTDKFHEKSTNTIHEQNNHMSLLLYNSTGGNIPLVENGYSVNTVAEVKDLIVGSVIERKCTFITPNSLHTDARWEILAYARMYRDGDTNGLMRDTVLMYDIKFEKGNKATDYSPAPQDIDSQFTTVTNRVTHNENTLIEHADLILERLTQSQVETVTKQAVDNLQIGGRNLILNSNVDVANTGTSYLIKQYSMSEDWKKGETYTISIKGTLDTSGASNQRWGIWHNGAGTNVTHIYAFDADSNGIVSKTFTLETDVTAYPRVLSVYNYPQGTAKGATIDWIKLEKGDKATDWTPAPEDTEAQIEVVSTNVSNVTTELERQAGLISQRVTKEEYEVDMENFSARIESAESYIRETADGIEAVVREKAQEIVDAEAEDIKDEILGMVNSDYDEFQERLSTAESKIDEKADSITLSATKAQIESRIQAKNNLILNGNGILGDATNVTGAMYDGSVMYNGTPSFHTNFQSEFTFNEFVPVDPTHIYRFGLNVKTGSPVTINQYWGIKCYDIDKLVILPCHVMYHRGSTTTLARELKNGDTKVYLTSIAGFNKSDSLQGHQRSLIFWNYKNRNGYQYPTETYSRNFFENRWTGSSSFNSSENSITLSSAWNGGTFPVGTSVSQGSQGSTYIYCYLGGTLTNAVDNWRHLSGTVTGLNVNGVTGSGTFRHGTAFVQICISIRTDIDHWINNVTMYDITQEKNANNYTVDQVNAAEARIKLETDNILLEVNQNKRDISDLGDTTTSLSTRIDEKADSITLEAAKTELRNYTDSTATSKANAAVNSLELGGTNLLKNSFLLDANWVSGGNGIQLTPTVTEQAFRGATSRKVDTTSYTSGYIEMARQTVTDILEPNQWYTLSFYSRGTGILHTYVYPNVCDMNYNRLADGAHYSTSSDAGVQWQLTSEWKRHTFTFRTKADLGTDAKYVLFRSLSGNAPEFCMPKLEKGNKATDYSIGDNELKEEIIVNKAQIAINATNIGLSVKNDTYQADKAEQNRKITSLDNRITVNEQGILAAATKTQVAQDIKNIEPSSRNCLLKSDFSSTSNTATFTFADGIATGTATAHQASGHHFSLNTSNYFRNNSIGKTVTFSMEYKIETALVFGTKEPWVGMQCSFKNANGNYLYMDWLGGRVISTAVSDGWQKHKITINIPKDAQSTITQLNFYFRDTTGVIKYKNPMLVIGTHANGWQLAPEDTETRLVSVEESVFTILPNQISGKVSQSTYDSFTADAANKYSDIYSKISANTNSINAKVSNTEYNSMAIGGYNFLPNANFERTYETVTAIPDGHEGDGYVVDKMTNAHPNLYAYGHGGLNSGLTNYATIQHAHIDDSTFDFNCYVFDETDGSSHWKAISPYINSNGDGTYSQGRLLHGTYCFSADIYVTGVDNLDQRFLSGGFHFTKIGGTDRGFYGTGNWYTLKPKKLDAWHRVWITTYLDETVDFNKGIAFYIYCYGAGKGKVFIKNVQLEYGNKPTAFGLGTELDKKIASLESRVQKAEFEIQKDSIVATVMESELFKEMFDDKADKETLKDYSTLEELQAKLDDIDYKEKIDSRVQQYLEDPDSNLMMKMVTKAQLIETKNSIQGQFSYANGLNFIHNSLGFGGVEDGYWIAGHANLAENGGTATTNNDYGVKGIVMSERLTEGKTYRVTVDVTPAANVTHFTLYSSGGYHTLCTLTVSGTSRQTVSATFVMGYYADRTPEHNVGYKDLQLYRFPNNGTVTTNSTIHTVKIEEGAMQTNYTAYGVTDNQYVTTAYDFDAEPHGFKSSFKLSGKTGDYIRLRQPFPTIVGKTYTVSFYYKLVKGIFVFKPSDDKFQLGTFNVIDPTTGEATGMTTELSTNVATDGYKLYVCNFVATSSESNVRFAVSASGEAYITGIMVHEGTIPLKWSQATGEQYNSNILMDINGIKVIQQDDNKNPVGYTEITPKSFSGYYDTDGDGDFEEIFTLKEDAVVTKRTVAKNEIIMGNLKFINLNSGGYTGWALVPSTANDWSLTEGTEQ